MKNFFSNTQKTANGQSIDANSFFKENNPEGYFTKPEFLTYLIGLRPKELKDLSGFINQMQKNAKFDSNLEVRMDRGGSPYVYPHIFCARGVKGFKIIHNESIQRLIDDYSDGKVTISFNAYELEAVINLD